MSLKSSALSADSFFLDSNYIRPSEEELENLCTAADQGDAEANFQLGIYYDINDDVRDLKVAAEHYEIAANKGLAFAQYAIAFEYHMGRGVQKDLHQAIEWYTKAADQGLAPAKFFLAMMYYHGEGVEKNLIKAADFCRQAADQDLAPAKFFLAMMYYRGEGVEKNLIKAAELFLDSGVHARDNSKIAAKLYHDLTAEIKKSLSSGFNNAAEGMKAQQQHALTAKLLELIVQQIPAPAADVTPVAGAAMA